MKLLAVIYHIPDLIRVEVLFPLDNGGKVGGGVVAGMVGFTDNDRRHGGFVLRISHFHNQGAVAFRQKVFLGQYIHQPGNIPVCGALSVPKVKGHAQLFIVSFHILDRDAKNLLPQSDIARTAVLQLIGGLVGFLGVFFIGFALFAGKGVHLAEQGGV